MLDINLTLEDVPVAVVADDKWIVDINVLSQEVQFRIDTGAKCNTLTLDCYQLLMHTGEMKRSSKVLRSYSNYKVKPVAAVNLPRNTKAVKQMQSWKSWTLFKRTCSAALQLRPLA